MSKTLEFYFDVGSPASYLAWTQVPNIARRQNAQLSWKPMLLGGVFKATGNQSPVTIPAKGAFMQADLARYAQRYDVPMQFSPFFPINTLQLMRGAIACQQLGKLESYLDAVFPALWAKGLDMGQPDIVAEVLHSGGFDPDEVFNVAGSAEVKARLITNTEEAVARGVFGAPSLFVDDILFFGQDRLDWVEQQLVAKA